MKPIVAIVGRANVGKSRLFNRLTGASRAIVDGSVGVTRDRHYASADWVGHEFIVVDTGGIDLDPKADLEKHVTAQSFKAVGEADVVVMVMDGSTGPLSLDEDIVGHLRKVDRPVLYAVNKIDVVSREHFLHAFHRLGVDPLTLVSAEHGRGISDLLDKMIPLLCKEGEGEGDLPLQGGVKVALVGRPNVGKSTLVNRLAGTERVVVHETPGTTRDAIDVDVLFQKRHYVFVDTAGVTRKFRMSAPLERHTAFRSLRAIERSDIVCVVLDACEGLARQDVHLAGFAHEEGKGILLLANKWDGVTKKWREYEQDLRDHLGELADVPILPLSAKTGWGCLDLFKEIDLVKKGMEATLSTSVLNRLLERALEEHHLPAYQGKPLHLYYATQVGKKPPTFIFFADKPQGIPVSYRRYLARRLQEELGVQGVPIRILLRARSA